MRLPSRWIETPAVRARFGTRLDRLAEHLWRRDPLADAAVDALAAEPWAERARLVDAMLDGASPQDLPGALVALREATHQVPIWFDPERAARGGAVFRRAGLLGGVVLALRSIVFGYLAPGGNKPLVFSGRLERDVPRRLVETSRFVRAVSAADGMRQGAPGFRSVVKVRLVHAEVRRMIEGSPRWRTDDWAVPINQADMCGTILLFSRIFVEGLGMLGYRLTVEEQEDHLHLWRYIGWVIGVDPELLPATVAEAEALRAMLEGTQGPPDADSRALARALIESEPATESERRRAERTRPLIYALSRHLVGDVRADQLGYPRDAWLLAPWALKHMTATAVELGRLLPLYDQVLEAIGERYWSNVAKNPEGGASDFVLPQNLAQA